MSEVIRKLHKLNPDFVNHLTHSKDGDTITSTFSAGDNGWGLIGRSKPILLEFDYKSIELISPNIDSIKPGSKVFFSSIVKFPRERFRSWAKDKKISVTIDPEKADVIITDKDKINGVIHKMSQNDIHCYLSTSNLNILSSPTNNRVLFSCNKGELIFNLREISNHQAIGLKYVGTQKVVELIDHSNGSRDKIINIAVDMANSYSGKKFMDVDTLRILLSKEDILDVENFQYICSALSSSDDDIVRLGLLTLSEFDLDKYEICGRLIKNLFWREIKSSTLYKELNQVVFALLKRWMDDCPTADRSNYSFKKAPSLEKDYFILHSLISTVIDTPRLIDNTPENKISIDLVNHYFDLFEDQIVVGYSKLSKYDTWLRVAQTTSGSYKRDLVLLVKNIQSLMEHSHLHFSKLKELK